MSDNGDPFERVLDSLSLLILGRPITDTLLHVAELARDAIPSADYVAMTTLRNARMEVQQPETTVATEPMLAIIDQAQYDANRGPCLDAFTTGQVFRIDLTEADDHPWPEFGRAAAAHGIRSTLSIPMMAAGDGVGALNLYSRRARAFSAEDEARGVRFAEPAAVLVTNAYLFWDARNLADNLKAALENRAVIEQAKGILMTQEGVDADGAFDLLRRVSQQENVKVRDIAQRLVDRTRAVRRPGLQG
jgi:GAF domain-containing protein